MGEIEAVEEPQHADVPEKRYREALALAAELGMRPLVAHCHSGLDQPFRRTGKQQQADGHLATATALCREMDMRFWLEQAEARSPQIGV